MPLNRPSKPAVAFAETKVCPIEEYAEALLPLLPVDKEGTVWKRGRMLGGWSQSYLKLQGSTLMISKKKDRAPNRSIHLPGYRARIEKSTKGVDASSVVFSLRHATKKSYTFCLTTPAHKADSSLSVSQAARKWVDTLNAKALDISMNDFEVLCDVGTGAYGSVQLVRRTATNALFALKRVPKDLTGKRPQENGESEEEYLARVARKNEKNRGWVLGERSSLQIAGEHPYLVNLRYAFQDAEFWYLVMDYVPGGDLFDHAYRQPNRCFDEPVVRQWLAELVVAIEHLHKHKIVHRDIKLENLLLDLQGHIHLADFGFARCLRLPNGKCGKTSLFCGTQYYIAPEMLIAPRAYDLSVDWWGIGVVAYELLTGSPPFYSRNRDRLYAKIVNRRVQFADDLELSRSARNLILQLLIKDPSMRLGYRKSKKVNGLSEVRRHPFFHGVNWDAVERGVAPSLYVPQSVHVEPVNPPASPYGSSMSTATPTQSTSDMFTLTEFDMSGDSTVRLRGPLLRARSNPLVGSKSVPPSPAAASHHLHKAEFKQPSPNAKQQPTNADSAKSDSAVPRLWGFSFAHQKVFATTVDSEDEEPDLARLRLDDDEALISPPTLRKAGRSASLPHSVSSPSLMMPPTLDSVGTSEVIPEEDTCTSSRKSLKKSPAKHTKAGTKAGQRPTHRKRVSAQLSHTQLSSIICQARNTVKKSHARKLSSSSVTSGRLLAPAESTNPSSPAEPPMFHKVSRRGVAKGSLRRGKFHQRSVSAQLINFNPAMLHSGSPAQSQS